MPRSHKQHISIAPGIHRDGDRLVATVRHGSARTGDQRRTRQVFPLGYDLDKIRAWQLSAKRDFLLEAPPAPGRGTLAGDIRTLLEQHIPEGRYREDLRALLAHWAASPLGNRARMMITRADVIAQRKRWLEAGHAINSCNKRLSALRVLYHTLDAAIDGAVPPSPADAVTYLKEPKPEPRAIPMPVVECILDALPDQGRAERGQDRPTVSHTKLRLRVFAWTGAAPATIARVTRRHLDLVSGQIYLTPRRKGAGAAGSWQPLLPQAVEALRDWLDAGLLGTKGSASSMGKTWRVWIKLAIEKARQVATETGDRSLLDALVALPPNCRPYDLRHSFGDELYRVTGDIRAVGEILQHASLETTKRYTARAVSDRVATAFAKMSAAHAPVTAPARPAPTTPTPRPERGLRLVRKTAN
jgi:site-specific recombinase XerC